MHYIFEAVLIGLYCVLLYLFVSLFLKINAYKYFFLFVLGFFKHFCGYYLFLHTYYCNNGYSCIRNTKNNLKAETTTKMLFIESLLEGAGFVFIGWVLSSFTKNWLLTIFIIGFLLHILFELLNIHKYFCDTRCKEQVSY